MDLLKKKLVKDIPSFRRRVYNVVVKTLTSAYHEYHLRANLYDLKT